MIAGVDGLLAELAGRGIRLSLAGPGQLRVAAPPGTLTPDLRALIADRKPEIIELLAAPPGPADLPRAVPDPAARDQPFPASDLQTSFLMGSRPGFEFRVRPHQYVEFDLDELEPARFEAALNAAVARRRADIVVAREDLTLQPVTDLTPVRVTVADLRDLPPAEAERRMLATRAELERTEPPHDVWPWLFPHITRYATAGGTRDRLHYNNNNLFTDARSAFGLVDEALRRYAEPGYDPPAPAVTFRECVLALAELEESPAGQRAKAYWHDRIPGWPAAPEVPLRTGAGLHDRSRLTRRELLFAPEIWDGLRRHGTARGLSMTSVLLGAYAEVLALWSGSRHFLLNNMVTHRLPLHEDVGEVFGNFASLYPLEVDWRPAEPMAARFRRLQATILADVSNLAYSGVKVLQELNRSRRTLGRAVCPYAIGSALFLGPARRPFHSTLETPQTLIDTEFWELDDGRLWITWDVYEELFPAGLIDAMQDAYRRAVEQLATGDAAWAAEALDLTPPAQVALRARINAATGVPSAELLHTGPDRNARTRPDRIAVRTDAGELSYADLQAKANALAARLVAAGTRPGGIVGVVLPKSRDQVIAVYAVLTAGAAYLPMDPGWPAERLRLLCADAGVSVVVGHAPVAGLLDGAPVSVVSPEGAAPVVDIPGPGTPDDLAYVIYTSGSTGRPKGARLNHRGPATTIDDIRRRFGIGADDVVFGLSALSFDLSVFDVFGTLAAGATLVLPPDGPADPAAWVRAVREHGVTVWNSVPALAQLLAGEAAAAGTTLPSLRVVLLSGDWIPVDLPDRLRAVAPGARIVSLGGATEASIWSIFHPVGDMDPEWTSIPYGRPLAHQSWHILDDAGRDVPDWVPGELYIGGAGVALGYHGDEERTRAAFVAHPRTGERLYRTGDLGRYRPGGDIELLGRADFQVKISGYRVEPGEIEHALLRCAGVEEAAVVARPSAGGKQLVAYVVGAAEGGALRRELAAGLPAYLVPAHIVTLDALPLTGNGKLDRVALRQLAAVPQDSAVAVAPRTPTEGALAAIWQDVLDRPAIGVHEDFFDLGGTSFAALRVISLAAADLGRRIPLGTLLERRTVAQLARWCDDGAGARTPLVRLSEGERPWYFVHPAGGEVLCYRGLAGLTGAGLSALQAPPPGELPGGIEELAARYVAEVRADGPGPYRLGGWSSGGVIAAEMTRQLEAAGAVVEALAVLDVPAPLTTREVDGPTLAAWFAEDVEGLPPGADLTAVRQVFDWVVRACSRYRAAPISAPMLVIRARDGEVTEFAGHPLAAKEDWGWSTVTTGPVAAVTLPGTHHTMLSDRHVPAVADALRRSRTDEGGTRERA
ncbi:non-ribosomal peptide synthetase [Hamadaea tsunoensis]|uniref:non-ribosomal peptide synthetase n=1 Tax=Hamadaea tsunoensis TaxID=53368 RepID=UPI000412DBCE|nr:non-ribosomal peptide synthetase [Hamadaea tsunoensis]